MTNDTKPMRTRILPKMTNHEVEDYLGRNDVIIVPVGTVEMHGGFPLDSETVISEALALRMAEACDGLVLTGLPYFYAGATAMGRGTVQCSVREGIDYLDAIARSLLRQGFTRQVYVSAHGPAHMTVSAMVRDFFDETGCPALYIDTIMALGRLAKAGLKDVPLNKNTFHAMTVGAYQIMGRLEDVPLLDDCDYGQESTVTPFDDILGLAYQSGSAGYYFGAQEDHMPTPKIPDEQTRKRFADEGELVIGRLVEILDMPHVVDQLAKLAAFEREACERFPWAPAAWMANRG